MLSEVSLQLIHLSLTTSSRHDMQMLDFSHLPINKSDNDLEE